MKGDIQYKMYLGWSHFYFTKAHTIFSHIDSPTFREVDEALSREKNTEKGKEFSLVHIGQRFACIKLEPLWTARWLKQGHCVYELLTIYTSVSSPAGKHLQIEYFMQKKVLGIFQSAKSQTQEIQSWEASAVFGDY